VSLYTCSRVTSGTSCPFPPRPPDLWPGSSEPSPMPALGCRRVGAESRPVQEPRPCCGCCEQTDVIRKSQREQPRPGCSSVLSCLQYPRGRGGGVVFYPALPLGLPKISKIASLVGPCARSCHCQSQSHPCAAPVLTVVVVAAAAAAATFSAANLARTGLPLSRFDRGGLDLRPGMDDCWCTSKHRPHHTRKESSCHVSYSTHRT